jgi:hypothetical protein
MEILEVLRLRYAERLVNDNAEIAVAPVETL